jgi:hypothetical protein
MQSDLKLLKQHQSATDPQITSHKKPLPQSGGGFFFKRLYEIIGKIPLFI